MRPLAACGLLLLLAGVATAEGPERDTPRRQPQLTGRVVGITDGDTLTLLVDRVPTKIRLAQIDAPERGQPYGRAAKQALSALAFGRAAGAVVVDTDRYGRSVAEVFVGGVHVNRAMVRGGHAWAYTRYSPSPAIIALEDEARAAKRGLWALPESQRDAPWVWRHRDDTPARERPVAPRPGPFSCGGRRTCGDMSSCEEARFHFRECGLARLDGDGDGVPCERLCGPTSTPPTDRDGPAGAGLR